MTRSTVIRTTSFVAAALAVAIVFDGGSVFAVDFSRLLRRLAKVADDVPVRGLDEAMEGVVVGRHGRSLVDDVVRRGGGKIDDVAERSRVLRKLWKETIGDADASLLRQLDDLPPVRSEAAVTMARGARRLESTIPDLAIRGRFLREGGGETLAAMGRYDDLVDDAVRFDLALQAGKLPSPAGARTLTLSDFGAFFHRNGERAYRFWAKSVSPHWKLWLGGTALAALLLSSDEMIDEAGQLTATAMRRLGDHLGDRLAAILAAGVEGTAALAEPIIAKTSQSLAERLWASSTGRVALALLTSGLVLILWPPVRRIVAFARNRGSRHPA